MDVIIVTRTVKNGDILTKRDTVTEIEFHSLDLPIQNGIPALRKNQYMRNLNFLIVSIQMEQKRMYETIHSTDIFVH